MTNKTEIPIDLTMIELFSGIGAQIRGIQNTGLFDCKVIATSDIDKDAIVSYAAVHCGLTQEMIDTYNYPPADEMVEYLSLRNIGYDPQKNKEYDWYKKRNSKDIKKYYLACVFSKNMGDISRIKKLPYADLVTYSFPRTDISVAGKQEGIIKGKTRSGLLYEVERLLNIAKENDTLPKYLLLENVKNLVGKQFKTQFDEWLNFLNNVGFNTYYQVINAKDCGIPQNRERVFAISIRKDIDTGLFTFPKPFDNGLRLLDMLEDETTIADKYYIKSESATKLIQEKIDDGTLEKEFADVDNERERVRYDLLTSRLINPILSREQTVSRQGMMQECQTSNKTGQELFRSGVSISNQGTNIEKKIEFAHTLMARDYKSFGNQRMTGVITHNKGDI